MANNSTSRSAHFGALLLLLFFGGSFLVSTFKSGASLHFLRGEAAFNNNERHLQRGGVAATIVNALVSFVTPAISRVVQNVLKQEFETLELAGRGGKEPGELTWEPLGSVIENVTLESIIDGSNETEAILCETSTEVKYAIESVKGLDNMLIDKLNFVTGSQKVDVGFMGRSDTTWEGQWNVELSFTETVMAATDTSYRTSTTTEECQADDVGDDMGTTSFITADEDINDPSRGSIAMENSKARVVVTVKGSTARLVLFASTTTVESATIESVVIDFPSVEINLGSSPLDTHNIGMQESSDTPTIIDADAEFGDVAKAGLENYVQSVLIVALQEELDRRFPTKLIV